MSDPAAVGRQEVQISLKPNQLYNPTAAGALLHNARTTGPGLSRQRVLRLIETGTLRAVKAGNGWVIEAAEVERFNVLERGKK